MIMEIEKSHDRPSARWELSRVGGINSSESEPLRTRADVSPSPKAEDSGSNHEIG